MDSQVDASQRKFVEPELAYELAMGGHTDSQVGSQVHASRIYTVHLQSTCVRWPNGEKLASTCVRIRASTKVNASQRKSTQVDGQTKHKLNASRKRASTCEAWALSGS